MSNIKTNIDNVIKELQSLLSTKKSGQIIKNGITVAIVGEPNVGKSSILNALTNSEKSIVTSVAGTTRDIVEAEYEYNGIIFRLFDTAGIHESNDEVERIGINRAKQILDTADIVLIVTTPNKNPTISSSKPSLLVVNKSDTEKDVSNANALHISAKTGENVETLKQKIFDLSVGETIDPDKLYVTNIRHIECINNSINLLNEAKNGLENLTLDLISSSIRKSWQTLGELTGSVSNEDVLDRVFNKFCLGK